MKSDVEKKYGPGMMRDWFDWLSSFFLVFTNSPADAWSRTAHVWKKLGKTPLEAVHEFRKKGVYIYGRRISVPESIPVAYAGRLDPMAEGILLLLVGETCKQIAPLRERDKTYVVEVLLGVSTDTGDLLGKIKEVGVSSSPCTSHTGELQKILRSFIGTHEWEYPVFSSKTVQGKPLFRWFYEGRLNEIEIPKRKMVIHELKYIDSRDISAAELLDQVKKRIDKVTKVLTKDKEWGNDFRREDVLRLWGERVSRTHVRHEQNLHDVVFTLVRLECRCGSGTYMRTLAEKIGQKLGVPSCAFSITRTRVG